MLKQRSIVMAVFATVLLLTSACGDSSSDADSGAADMPVLVDGPQPDGPQPDGPQPDGPTPDGPVPDGPVPDGPVPDGPVPDGPVPDGPVPDGPVPDGPVPDGPVPDVGIDAAPLPDGPMVDAPTLTTVIGQIITLGACSGVAIEVRERDNTSNTTMTSGGNNAFALDVAPGGAFVLEAVAPSGTSCMNVWVPLNNLQAGTTPALVLFMLDDTEFSNLFPGGTYNPADGAVVFEMVQNYSPNSGNESSEITSPSGLIPWAWDGTAYVTRPSFNLVGGISDAANLRNDLLFYIDVPVGAAAMYTLGGGCTDLLNLGDAPVAANTLTHMFMACTTP